MIACTLTLRRAVGLGGLMVCMMAQANTSTRTAESLPRSLYGVWLRIDDAFAGTIVEIGEGASGTIGTLIFANQGATEYGFRPGDVKFKSFSAATNQECEVLSLVKTGAYGEASAEWYEEDMVYVRSDDELLLRQKHGSEMKVGAWQRWLRLDVKDKRFGDYLYGKGMIAEANADWQTATREYQAALTHNDREPRYLNAVAWRLAVNPHAMPRQIAVATKHALTACTLTNFQDPIYVDTLAAAYAAAGDFDRALQYQQRACRLLEEPQDDFLGRLALYRGHRAYVAGTPLNFNRNALLRELAEVPAGSSAEPLAAANESE